MIWAFLEFYVAHEKLIIIFKIIYENAKVAIRVGTDLGQWLKQEKGVRQSDPISPNVTFTA